LRLLFIAAIVAPCAHAQVELRGGVFVEDPVVAVSAAGVAIERNGTAQVFGWHEVKRVGGQYEGAADAYARLSDDLWRAISRLDRNDVPLAAPILERLWSDAIANEDDPQTVAGVRLVGSTGLAIARGVTTVRIAQGRLADAVESWAASVALTRAIAGDAADGVTPLDPSLPPIFVQSVAVERLANARPPAVVERDPLASTLFAWYRASAAHACGLNAETSPSSGDIATVDAVRFVSDLIVAQHGPTNDRASAGQRLRDVIDANPGEWREAWARTSIGIAQVTDPQGRERIVGALELMHLPARFATTQPYLAGIALAWASVALEAEGDVDHAASLRAELESRFPESAAIGWLARRAVDGGAP
jgi:hypothetical protein